MAERQFTLADVAEGVHRLIRRFGVEPFERMLFEWVEAVGKAADEFDKARKDHLFPAEPLEERLRDKEAGPPDKDWEWDWDRAKLGDVSQTHYAWFPPDLVSAKRPYIEYPLPLPEKRDLTLPEEYAALIAIHAVHWKGKPISPWTGPEDSFVGWNRLRWLVKHAEQTPESDAVNLRCGLEDVEADLGAKYPQPPATPKRQRKRRKAVNTPLTPRQVEAVSVVGECHGDVTEAAKRMGLDRSTVRQHYKAGMEKLQRAGVKQSSKPATTPSTQTLPTDRRGQANIADGDDKRQ